MQSFNLRTRLISLSLLAFFNLFLISSLSASGMRIGAASGWLETFYFYNDEANGNFTHEHYDNVEVSIFADWKYFRGSAGYSKHVLSYVYDNGKEKKYTDYNISFLNFLALAKYPFDFFDSKLQLWPALGLEHSINLKYEKDGKSLTGRYDELDDFYLQCGAGADYALSPRVALTGTFLAGLNLTPRPGESNDIGSSFKGANARFLIGFSYSI